MSLLQKIEKLFTFFLPQNQLFKRVIVNVQVFFPLKQIEIGKKWMRKKRIQFKKRKVFNLVTVQSMNRSFVIGTKLLPKSSERWYAK